MAIPEIPISLTAEEKLKIVWEHLNTFSHSKALNKTLGSCTQGKHNKKKNHDSNQPHREWPSYNEVLQDVRKSDYNEMLDCPLDLRASKPGNQSSNTYSMERLKAFRFSWSHNEPKSPNIAAPPEGVSKLSFVRPKAAPTRNSCNFPLSGNESKPPIACPVPQGMSVSASSRTKTICAQGVLCTAKLELFHFPDSPESEIGKPYTGILTPGRTVHHCIVRLSSALQPMGDDRNRRVARLMFGEKLASAKIFPGVAIKFFRTNQASANALFLGSKVGQTEPDFFAHCLSTQITSKMPTTLKPILGIFKRYSQYPLALGLSNLCNHDVDGNCATKTDGSSKSHEPRNQTRNNFPFCLTLAPRRIVSASKQGSCAPNETEIEPSSSSSSTPTRKEPSMHQERTDSFLDDLLRIPSGSLLYDVFASPDPLSVGDASRLHRIGRLVSSSEMIESPQDDGLFFRHQNKDEDFSLRPHWKDQVDRTIVLRDGSRGAVSALAGWKLFEQQIQGGEYRDFEKHSTTT